MEYYYYNHYFDKMYHSLMIHLLKYNLELNVFLSMMDKHFDYYLSLLFDYYNYSNYNRFLEEHIFGFYLFVYLIVVFYLELFAVDLLFRH